MPSRSHSPWFGTSWSCAAACLSVLSFRLQILGSPASIKITVFWDVTPCSFVGGHRTFGKNLLASFCALSMEAACYAEILVTYTASHARSFFSFVSRSERARRFGRTHDLNLQFRRGSQALSSCRSLRVQLVRVLKYRMQ
jgi:hypothetical protein